MRMKNFASKIKRVAIRIWYIVFEHGAFDFETENAIVEARIEKAMKEFDYSGSGYQLDLTPGRVFYFYHDCKQFWKYVRPVIKRK